MGQNVTSFQLIIYEITKIQNVHKEKIIKIVIKRADKMPISVDWTKHTKGIKYDKMSTRKKTKCL